MSGTYANTALTCNISNVVIRYATRGVAPSANNSFTVQNAQFQNCGFGIETSVAGVARNCLFNRCTGAFNLTAAKTNIGEHLTITESTRVNLNFGDYLLLTNCLVVATTNYGSFAARNSMVRSNSIFSDVFQTVGAGRHYLKYGSSFRGIGNTNIGSAMLSEIRQRTTYPPAVITNATISTNTGCANRSSRKRGAGPRILFRAARLRLRLERSDECHSDPQ